MTRWRAAGAVHEPPEPIRVGEAIEATDDEAALPLESWITYRFGLVTARAGRYIAAMYRERHGLRVWEWRALAVISRYEPLSAKELAARSSTDPINVARAIHALVRKGLVSRLADPRDRRRAVLRLTARGRAVHGDIARAAVRMERAMTATLSARERAALGTILAKIDAAVATRLLAHPWQEFVGHDGDR